MEEFIPYFHFDHINKLKDYLSNNNSYLSSILQDKKNLVYLNDAVLKLIKFVVLIQFLLSIIIQWAIYLPTYSYPFLFKWYVTLQ